MATADQEQRSRSGLKEELQRLAKYKPEDLIRERDLGSHLNFREGLPSFERMLKLYHNLEKADLDGVANTVIENHRQLAAQARQSFDAILAFDPNQANPKAQRDHLIQRVRDGYDGHFQQIAPTIAYSIRSGTDFEALEKEARQSLDALLRISEDGIKQKEQLKTEVDGILKSMRDAAAEVGVGHHALNFKNQADEHAATSEKWLYATGTASLLSMGVLWLLFIGPLKPDVSNMNTGQAIYELVSRLMVFSLASFGIYWAAKNFESHRHNYVVNKHRQNALTTFQTFIRAAEKDQVTKNAVLLQAAQAIYLPQASGYGDGTGVQAPTSVLEVIKKISPSGD